MQYRRNGLFNGDQIGNGFIRLGLAGGAVAGWYVSLMFSVMGFQAWNSNPIMTRLAYCTVAFFTALQLWVNHQNREDPNYGLAISGIVSYGFGIITNIMGILVLGGTTIAIAWDTGQYWQIALAACLGIPLEIGPESLLMKAIFPNSRNLVSDAVQGAWNVISGVIQGINGGGSSYTPAPSHRSRVDDMTSAVRSSQSTRSKSQNPSNPRWNTANRNTSAPKPDPIYRPITEEDDGNDFHMLG